MVANTLGNTPLLDFQLFSSLICNLILQIDKETMRVRVPMKMSRTTTRRLEQARQVRRFKQLCDQYIGQYVNVEKKLQQLALSLPTSTGEAEILAAELAKIDSEINSKGCPFSTLRQAADPIAEFGTDGTIVALRVISTILKADILLSRRKGQLKRISEFYKAHDSENSDDLEDYEVVENLSQISL